MLYFARITLKIFQFFHADPSHTQKWKIQENPRIILVKEENIGSFENIHNIFISIAIGCLSVGWFVIISYRGGKSRRPEVR